MAARALCVAVLGLVLWGGCTDAGAVRAAPAQRVIADAGPEAVLAAAASLLQREFGRVRVDPDARRIVTVPAEFTTGSASGSVRDLYGGRSTMRRVATFDVAQRAGATVARLRIDVERLDTARQRVMHPRGYRLSDAPGEDTPVARDAATTEEQNTVWTRVRRDRSLERALLEELRARFEPAAPPPGAPAGEPAAAAPAQE